MLCINKGKCAYYRCTGNVGRFRCSQCKLINYCCAAHQKLDHSNHKSSCKNHVSNLKQYQDVEKQLNDAEKDDLSTAEIRFSKLRQDYLGQKYVMIMMAQQIPTQEAAEFCLLHCMSYFEIDRCDVRSVRDITASLLMRLRKDQECYDFIKWWMLSRPDEPLGYDHKQIVVNPPLKSTFLNLHNQDCTESLFSCCVGNHGLSLIHRVVLVILKFNLRVVLETLEKFKLFLLGTHARIGAKSPVLKLAGCTGVLQQINAYLPKSNAMPKRAVILQKGGFDIFLENINHQMYDMWNSADSYSPYTWLVLHNPNFIPKYGARLLERFPDVCQREPQILVDTMYDAVNKADGMYWNFLNKFYQQQRDNPALRDIIRD